MITVPAGARILLATRPVDFRKGGHSLAALAQEVLAADPFSDAVIVYRSKRANRVKLLIGDHSGLVLVWKQLQQGSFHWPPIKGGVMTLSPVAFTALFDGLNWTRVQTTKVIYKPTHDNISTSGSFIGAPFSMAASMWAHRATRDPVFRYPQPMPRSSSSSFQQRKFCIEWP